MLPNNNEIDYLGMMIQYEQGELSYPEMITLFSYLVDTGMAWSLQGHYGRVAATLIENGIITPESKEENPLWN